MLGCWDVRRAVPTPNSNNPTAQVLLQLDAPPSLLELALQLLALVALDALLDRLRRLVDERLGLLQAEARGGAYDLDHLDLLVARGGQHDVDGRRGLLGRAVSRGACAGSGRGSGGHGGRRYAELLLERLDPLGQLEHRNALELL